MTEGARRQGAHRSSNRTAGPPGGRRSRAVLISGTLALLLVGAVAAGARASGGGISSTSTGGASPNGPAIPFGARVLRLGMEGNDVAVLNGIVRSKGYGRAVRLGAEFRSPTASAVMEFQRRKDLKPSGTVTRTTAEALTGSMRHSGATWYGPGFYGNQTACGRTLRINTIGVAHKTLPCGTKVTFYYHGRSAIAQVIDRGPYTRGNDWDLTNGLRKILNFSGSDQIRYAVSG